MKRQKQNDGPSQDHVSGQSNRTLSKPAHALEAGAVAGELETDYMSGLSVAEADRRLEEFGPNELGEAEGVQPIRIIVAQIANAMTLVTRSISPAS